MKINEYTGPKLIALHYFNIPGGDRDMQKEFGLKIDKTGKMYLPQYDKSGSKFDRNYTTLNRIYGLNRTVKI